MSKPRKVEEPQAPYAAKKAAAPCKPETKDVRYLDEAAFKKAAEKIFATRSDLLRRLAQ